MRALRLSLMVLVACSMMFTEGCAISQLLGGLTQGQGQGQLGGLNPGQLGGTPLAGGPLQGPIQQPLPFAPQTPGPIAAAPGATQPQFTPAAPQAPGTTVPAPVPASLPANTPVGVQPPPPPPTTVATPTTPQPGPPGIGTV